MFEYVNKQQFICMFERNLFLSSEICLLICPKNTRPDNTRGRFVGRKSSVYSVFKVA